MTPQGLRIGIVSDSPALTTGYGIVTDQACRALLSAGHHLRVFGFKDDFNNPARAAYPCEIVPIDPFTNWHPELSAFASDSGFDVLWIYMDMYCLEEVMQALEGAALPPLSLYAIFDGLPVYGRLLRLIERFETVMVTNDVGAAYLQANGLRADVVAPPGIDRRVFRPLDRAALRAHCGLDGNRVIGVFGRNTQRKQQPRVLMALEQLRQAGEADDLMVYFHCSRAGYWDLEELADRYNVRSHVLFADDLADETRGAPLRGRGRRAAPSGATIPEAFGYVERLNLCDVVINTPHSGDFEQVLIEAPACGVPVAATNDDGIMRAALGPGTPLAGDVAELGNTGQALYYVKISAIEQAIREAHGPMLAELVRRSKEWAYRHGWKQLRSGVVKAVEAAVGDRKN